MSLSAPLSSLSSSLVLFVRSSIVCTVANTKKNENSRYCFCCHSTCSLFLAIRFLSAVFLEQVHLLVLGSPSTALIIVGIIEIFSRLSSLSCFIVCFAISMFIVIVVFAIVANLSHNKTSRSIITITIPVTYIFAWMVVIIILSVSLCIVSITSITTITIIKELAVEGRISLMLGPHSLIARHLDPLCCDSAYAPNVPLSSPLWPLLVPEYLERQGTDQWKRYRP